MTIPRARKNPSQDLYKHWITQGWRRKKKTKGFPLPRDAIPALWIFMHAFKGRTLTWPGETHTREKKIKEVLSYCNPTYAGARASEGGIWKEPAAASLSEGLQGEKEIFAKVVVRWCNPTAPLLTGDRNARAAGGAALGTRPDDANLKSPPLGEVSSRCCQPRLHQRDFSRPAPPCLVTESLVKILFPYARFQLEIFTLFFLEILVLFFKH